MISRIVCAMALVWLGCREPVRTAPAPDAAPPPPAPSPSAPAPIASIDAGPASSPRAALPSRAQLAAPFRGTPARGFVAMTNGAERLFVPIGSSEPVAETRPVPVASFTKLWVAVAVLALVREGKLTLDVTIRETLPELSARPWADSTVRELLTHTSRVPEFDEKGGFYGRADVDFSKPVDMLVMHLSREATEKRGVFRYRNAEFALLGAILAVREGKPAGAVLAQRVFEPAHMTRSGLLVGQPPPDLDLTPLGRVRSRNFFTAGAGYASPRDLIAFFEALAGDTLLDAPSRALLFAGSTARDGGAFGCWAYPYDVADAGTSLLVERPGGLGNVRLVSTFLPRTGRAVVAFSSEPIDLGRPRTRGIARSFARLAFE